MGIQIIDFDAVDSSSYNGVSLSKILINSVEAWTEQAAPGQIVHTVNGTFIVPAGYTSLDLDLFGAGGNAGGSLGGSAGQRRTTTMAVTPGETLTITVPALGSAGATSVSGLSGTISASGGASNNYTAAGRALLSYGWVYNQYAWYYRGQSSAIGSGGTYGSGFNSAAGGNGGTSAGGGGSGGRGGRGESRISWGQQ